MFGLCFLSALNAQEEGFNKLLPLATTPNDFTLSPVTNAESDRHSSDSSPVAPSALDDAVAQAFAGVAALTELNHQHQRALQETLRATGENTRSTELLGQVVTAQSESLIDAKRNLKLTLEELTAIRAELAASRITRESDRKAQYEREQKNRADCHKWLLEIERRSGINEALALIGGALFGAWAAYQMMLDNLNGGSSGHH